MQRSIEGPGTEPDAAVAQNSDLLHQRVAVARLVDKTHQDQQHGLRQRRDLSHNDMLRRDRRCCQGPRTIRVKSLGCQLTESVPAGGKTTGTAEWRANLPGSLNDDCCPSGADLGSDVTHSQVLVRL